MKYTLGSLFDGSIEWRPIRVQDVGKRDCTSSGSVLYAGYSRDNGRENEMTYLLTLRLENPNADLLSVKEALAYDLEKYGDLSLVSISEEQQKQISLWKENDTHDS